MVNRSGITIARVAIILALLVLWEALSRTGLINPRLLPSASDTLATLADLLQRASVRNDLLVTATEVFTAFAIAVPFGCLIGYLIAYGATAAQTAFRVYLPSMLPVLLEALRISMIFNLTGVILAEMYASRDGIGHQIATWGENFQMKQLLAGVVMIAAVAIAFNELVRWVETRCSHWRT